MPNDPLDIFSPTQREQRREASRSETQLEISNPWPNHDEMLLSHNLVKTLDQETFDCTYPYRNGNSEFFKFRIDNRKFHIDLTHPHNGWVTVVISAPPRYGYNHWQVRIAVQCEGSRKEERSFVFNPETPLQQTILVQVPHPIPTTPPNNLISLKIAISARKFVKKT